MAKRVVACLGIVLGLRDLLWPDQPPPDGKTVRQRLFSFLADRLREAPQRGRGAYLRRFIEHIQAVTCRYSSGLFYCYDNPAIPHTTNGLERSNGSVKRNLRRCAGRASTANGPGSSYGWMYMCGVILHECLPLEELEALLLEEIPLEAYREAREELDKIRGPASRRRAFLRNPEARLAEILERWHAQ